ncbi:hypothetical protein [Paenibacillus qinlingensis]|uniref:PD-(D/E)XK nuclease domain-containing protein n=1 Tax=Paenibacillus qinlingensis TaxID=1837343 RepID=UPI001566A1AE|nr:hypothetical protein [Paenibacillus qinlingensis]NQX63743.1 hypothetical protein [Paenibacillus qinlingensis]
MTISEIRGEKSNIIENLNDQILKGERLLKQVDALTSLEIDWESWCNTTLKILQSSFSGEEVAKSFLFVSSTIGISKSLRKNENKELVDSLLKALGFIRGLVKDIKLGLHDNDEPLTFNQPVALLVIKQILKNFHLHLQSMYQDEVHGNAKIKKEDLNRILIGNEYDVQRILYALIRPIFPESRMEVTEDAGYKSVRYDIYVDDFNLAIEVKCTRASMTERHLTEELGADAFHYKTEHLLLFIYDKEKIIVNADAFKKSFKREKTKFGKNIETFVIQPIIL